MELLFRFRHDATLLFQFILLFLMIPVNVLCDINVQVDKIIKAPKLTCYDCYEAEDGCLGNITIVRTKECRFDEPYCKVEKMTDSGRLTQFKRQCTRECTSGCTEFLEFERCVSCCKTKNCNTGSGATRLHEISSISSVLFLLVVECVLQRL